MSDDQTDEDVFALSRHLPLLAVRVGRRPRSLAPYYLTSQADVDALLAELRDLCAQQGEARKRQGS